MQPVINVCTPGSPDPYDSFGLLSIQTSRYLTRLGAYVNLFSLGPRDLPTQDEETRAILAQPIRAGLGMLGLGYPTTFSDHPGLTQLGPRVGICMWESTVPPAQFINPVNQCQAIITPCHFCEQVFRDAGVTVPIHVVPLGINEIYRPAERSTDRPFTFVTFIDRGLRKGGIEAMRAFQEAFGDDPNYKLILKGRTSKINATILNPNIELIQRDMTEAELYDLYLQADAMIFSTRGEGWGLPCREFASTGGIALATNFAGTADHIEQWGVPLDYRLVKADWAGHNRLSKMDLGQWAEVINLPDVLGDIADNRAFYADRAARQAPAVQKLYSWETFAQKVLNIWEGVQ